MLHPLPLPLSSCLGCIPPLIGLPSLRFYAVGSSLFLLSVCFCLCSLFYRDDVLCWLLLARPFLYAFHAHLRFPVDLVWFRLSCDHGWIRSGSVNVRKQQQQQQPPYAVGSVPRLSYRWRSLGYFILFFNLTYSRCTSALPSCLWSQRIFPSLPGSRLTIFLSRCKFSTLTTRQPMVEFYLLTSPRFPLRKKEHKSYFGKNRTHDFRTSRCADYLLDHSGDDYHRGTRINAMKSFCLCSLCSHLI